MLRVWRKRLCPQVHCVALVQGVQEGGEMNGRPLPREERQQFVRGFHLKTPTCLGLFLFLWGMRRENDSPDPLELLLKTPPYKSRIWKITASPFRRPKQLMLEAFSVLNIYILKKKNAAEVLEEREENKWTRYWIGFSIYVSRDFKK